LDYLVVQLALAYFQSEKLGTSERFAQNDDRRQAMRFLQLTTTPAAIGEA
jgi:hypothetical protein